MDTDADCICRPATYRYRPKVYSRYLGKYPEIRAGNGNALKVVDSLNLDWKLHSKYFLLKILCCLHLVGRVQRFREVEKKLKPGHKPFEQSVPRNVVILLLPKLADKVDRLVMLDIIEPIWYVNKWLSPIVYVPKVNKELNKAKYFSKIDCNKGIYKKKYVKIVSIWRALFAPLEDMNLKDCRWVCLLPGYFLT